MIGSKEAGMKNENERRVTAPTRKNYRALTKALTELMSERNYGDISVVEICEKSKVQRVTFYNYFEDKDDLLRFCVKELMGAFSERVKIGNEVTDEDIDKLTRLTISFIGKYRTVVENLFNEKDGKGVFIIQRIISGYFSDKAATNDSVSVPAGLYGEYCSASIVFAIKWWLDEGKNYTEDQMVKYVKLLINAERFIEKND